jgi:hypothetical protein
MSSTDLQSLVEFLKSISGSFLNKSFAEGSSAFRNYVFPTLRSLLSSHPDIMSLFLLLITLYVSLLVLNTASRWMYSFVMGFVRMLFMGALVLGVVWAIKVGQGEDASATMNGGIQWAINKGKRYVFGAAAELFKR